MEDMAVMLKVLAIVMVSAWVLYLLIGDDKPSNHLWVIGLYSEVFVLVYLSSFLLFGQWDF